MSVKLNPYINFNGNAREVLEFYHKIFGGKLDIKTFSEYPEPPAGYEDKVMHGVIETDDLTLMASDAMPGSPDKTGSNMGISVSGDDEEKLTKYFNELSEGGEVTVKFEKQVWGDAFGMLKDKFGVDWMVNITKG